MHQRDEATHELVSAYLDGELTRDERTRVEHLLTTSPDHRQVFEEMRAVGNGLRQLPTWQLDPEFPARVIDRVRAARTPGDEADRGGRRADVRSRAGDLFQAGPRSRLIAATALAAAVLLLVWGTGWIVWNLPGGTGRLARTDRPADFDQDAAPVPPGDRAPEKAPRPGEPTSGDDATSGVTRSAPAPADPERRSPARGEEQAGRGQGVGRSDRGVVTDSERDLVAGVAPVEGRVPSPPDVPSPEPAMAAPPSADDDGPPPVPVPAVAPLNEQLLLVMDVVLTPVGKQRAAFEQALAAQGITYDAAVTVGAELEKTLLASRFFDPLVVPESPLSGVDQQTGRQTGDAMSLVYVITRAGHVDDLWQLFDTDPDHFQQVTMDLAVRPEDLSMFADLRRAIDGQDAVSVTAADAEHDRRRAAAHQLLLAPGWRGTPATKLKGLGAMAGLVPDWLLGLPPQTARSADRLGSKDADAAIGPPRPLSEETVAEILFVVRYPATTASD
jgi:hypothetical protein